jgi:hypothetical protein
VLVVALVCLLVVMTILGAALQGTLLLRRQWHVERDLRQTELLMQAGLDRAAWRLAGEPDYRGETWTLPAEAIVGTGGGQVVIQLERESPEEPWQVHVTAEYPVGSERSIRRSRDFLVQSQQPRNQE